VTACIGSRLWTGVMLMLWWGVRWCAGETAKQVEAGEDGEASKKRQRTEDTGPRAATGSGGDGVDGGAAADNDDSAARADGDGGAAGRGDCVGFVPTQPCAADKAYLCTGYDCYVVGEPCIMCAMALVHSRVRRVYFAAADSRGGALGSRWALQSQKGLNHHYMVFSLDAEQVLTAGAVGEGRGDGGERPPGA
jgi:hypothetical protein